MANKNPMMNLAFMGTGIYLLMIFLITKIFDPVSYILYAGIGVFAVMIMTKKKMTPQKYFMIGALIPIVYNFGGALLGWFQVPLPQIFAGAVFQGVVFFLLSGMKGGRK